jgi:hypothetical protein
VNLFTFFNRKPYYFYVRPRYSAGSPAMVTERIAFQVAADERYCYEHTLSGAYGEEQKKRAEVLGLRGIAYAMAEHGSGRKFRWLVFDLVTGERFRRHHDEEIRRLEFRPYLEIPEPDRRQINKTGRDSDYDRTFWRYSDFVGWVQYQPEPVALDK